ncbi:hypothetical protein BC351_27330 [Paenibacillus ferrarius]|uniref:Uncharacterized protein n=1 Tax=Paenibacillus ferrarius TaxID=1469647 RepID=A0A1V4HIR7_9BACL|nr:hypothetical protein [Paenibacillus ferrarius]OPH56657.1 hypothetical protein BC351_27330 [Paenibacillus ferrarius]
MGVEKRNKLSLLVPFIGKLNIVQIRDQPINSKYTLIDIIELEKFHFKFISSLCLPTNHQVIYGFELTIFNQSIHVLGGITLVSNTENEYVYKAIIKQDKHANTDTEMLYMINQLAVKQNNKYGKLVKSYATESLSLENTVDLIC